MLRPPIPKPVPRKRERRTRAQEHKAATAELRGLVVARARGKCECGCGIRFGFGAQTAEMDHLLGGSGRRRQQQAVTNVWMLTRNCHAQRHAARPSAEQWRARIAAFCQRHGLPGGVQ